MKRVDTLNIALGALVVAACLTVAGSAGAQGTAQENLRLSPPRSGLETPFFADRIHLVGFANLGFGGPIENLQTGGGVAFVIRPGTAERFLEFLADWNASLVLQGEYHRVAGGRRILSGDALVRRYVNPFGEGPGRSLFYGVGAGASDITRTDGLTQSGIEAVLETGQEWNRDGRLSVAFWQFQYRFFRYHGTDFSHWSVKVGAGVPLPW